MKVGEKYFGKRDEFVFFYEISDEFVVAPLCACFQGAFSESRRASFAYMCIL